MTLTYKLRRGALIYHCLVVILFFFNWLDGFAEHTDSIGLIFCGASVAGWTIISRQRATSTRVKNLFVNVGLCLELLFFFQIARYNLPLSAASSRLLWYAYYIPLVLIPLLILYITIRMYDDVRRRTEIFSRLLLIPAGIFIALFLTNDFHQLAFSFPTEIQTDEAAVRGVVFYLFLCWVTFLLIASLTVMFVRSHSSAVRMWGFLPLGPVVLGILLFGVMEYEPSFLPSLFRLTLGEAFAVMYVGFCEMCMVVGLIPCNVGYRDIYTALPLRSVIIDRNLNIVINSMSIQNRYPEHHRELSEGKIILADDNNLRLSGSPVQGGWCLSAEDISFINRINEELAETTERINIQNELLSDENELIGQTQGYEEKSRVYTDIAGIVSPQLQRIKYLISLSESDDRHTERLIGICILLAYIKRRSNLELLAYNNENLSLGELFYSITESLEYLGKRNIRTALAPVRSWVFPAHSVCRAYDCFEAAVENLPADCTAVSISIGMTGNRLFLRFMLDSGDTAPIEKALEGMAGEVTVLSDGRDSLVKIMIGGNEHESDC